jgi:hypothetical protein
MTNNLLYLAIELEKLIADEMITADHQSLVTAEVIIAAANEITELREKLATTKRGLTQSIRNLETIYGVIDKLNAESIHPESKH